MNTPDPELQDWANIIKESNTDNPPSRASANVKSLKKLVFAIANLRFEAGSIRKKIVPRLEHLKASIDKLGYLKGSIDKFNEASSRLYKINICLTAVIAYATLMSVVINIGFSRKILVMIALLSLVIIACIIFIVFKKIKK